MLGEEGQATKFRQFAILGAVAWPFLAAEAVLGALVNENGHVRVRGLDGADLVERDVRVGFAEMQLHRAVQ